MNAVRLCNLWSCCIHPLLFVEEMVGAKVPMHEFDDAFQPMVRSDLRIGTRVRDRDGHYMPVIQDAVFKGLRSGYQISPAILDLLPFLDGKTPLHELPERLKTQLGLTVNKAAMHKVIAELVRYDLLDTPEVREKRDALETTYRQTRVRPPCEPAKFFLPQDADTLRMSIERCFLETGQGENINSDQEPIAFLLPHGDLRASGQTTAWALRAMGNRPLPERYIIIGPNHIYPAHPCVTTIYHPFQTPLGIVEVDQSAVSSLEQLAEGHIRQDYISHYRDHSIEIILPFLQWLHCQSSPDSPVRIVPLLTTGEHHPYDKYEPESHRQVWRHVGQALARFLEQTQERTLVIVSGDFTHWGPSYNFQPFSGTDRSDFYEWDQPLLQAIVDNDPEGFLEHWQATNCCAGRPMYITLNALQALQTVHWSQANYHVAWCEENAISFASFVAYASAL